MRQDRSERQSLLAITRQYRNADTLRSLVQLAGTLGLWAGCYAAGLWAIGHSVIGTVLAAIGAAAFLVRLFIIQHDCSHHAYFRSPRANNWVGACLGFLSMTPHQCWRRFHLQHHAHSGNLDRRGRGEILTLTTIEYAALTRAGRLLYRTYRHPVLLFFLAPPFLFIVRQRFVHKMPVGWSRERASVHATNVVVAATVCAVLILASRPYSALMFHLAVVALASMAGVWLFYMQHQFPNGYWRHEHDWESWRSSMEGATYYQMPCALRWLTANIGLHHIHHLDPGIPNYRLYRCFVSHPHFANPTRLDLKSSLTCTRLRLWDPAQQCMVSIVRRG